MGNGTKIGLVLVLVLAVVVFANLLDNEVQRGPDGVDQAPKNKPEETSRDTSRTSRDRTTRNTPRLDQGRSDRLARNDERRRADDPRKTVDPNRGTPNRTNTSPNDRTGTAGLPITGRDPSRTGTERPSGGERLKPSPTEAGRGKPTPAVASDPGNVKPSTNNPAGTGPRIVGVDPNEKKTETSPRAVPPKTDDKAPSTGRELANRTGEKPKVTPPPARGFPKTHEVVDGDSLWKLADSYYKKPTLFTLILNANPGLGDGSELQVGQKLKIPAPPAGTGTMTNARTETPKPRAGFRPYVIQEGDTLYDIAEEELGSGPRWTEILKANPGLDPARLQVGKVVQLPSKT